MAQEGKQVLVTTDYLADWFALKFTPDGTNTDQTTALQLLESVKTRLFWLKQESKTDLDEYLPVLHDLYGLAKSGSRNAFSEFVHLLQVWFDKTKQMEALQAQCAKQSCEPCMFSVYQATQDAKLLQQGALQYFQAFIAPYMKHLAEQKDESALQKYVKPLLKLPHYIPSCVEMLLRVNKSKQNYATALEALKMCCQSSPVAQQMYKDLLHEALMQFVLN